MKSNIAVCLLAVSLTACGETAKLPFSAGVGPDPKIPHPARTAIPTVRIAEAIGWPAGVTPTPAKGLAVRAFATGLDHPRWLHVLPNGDVLVAESNAPPKPEDAKGIKGAIMKSVMKKAGAGVPSANRITLLRDDDGDGVAETRTTFMSDLNSPFGMQVIGDVLYIANTDAVVKVPYASGVTSITVTPQKVADLPAGPINHHWTKNILASRDGKKLYVTVGSNSNVAENGMAAEENRAAILEIDLANGATRRFASGLRNPNGLAWEPHSGALWTVVNERDELGSDLVPDYLTSVREGGFYGWPFSYYGQHVDTRVTPQNPDLVAKAIVPDYALGSHVAPLGLAFYTGTLMPNYAGGALIGRHGSWNRNPISGYDVVLVPFGGGRPAGPPQTVLDGFVNADGKAMGRPVGIEVDKSGAILVADDVGNVIWRVAPGG